MAFDFSIKQTKQSSHNSFKKGYYYAQSSDFTCGAASLIMAMKALNPDLYITKELEYTLWREANTLYMGNGHPGTNQYGLALSALKRGFFPTLLVEDPIRLFESWNRNNEKIILSQALIAHDYNQVIKNDVPVYQGAFSFDTLLGFGKDTSFVILTGNQYYKHWVTVISITEEGAVIHDPWRDKPTREETNKAMFRLIGKEEFNNIIAHGKRQSQAVIVLQKRIQENKNLRTNTNLKKLGLEDLNHKNLKQTEDCISKSPKDRQITDFTCGPHLIAHLIEQQKRLENPFLIEELNIWREANMVVAGKDKAGCGPYALALSAKKRGLAVHLRVYNPAGLLTELTKDISLRQIQILMEAEDRHNLIKHKVPISEDYFDTQTLEQDLAQGYKLITLVKDGSYGHWILIDSIKNGSVFYYDPWITNKSLISKPVVAFDKLLTLGPSKTMAALLVK